MISEVIARAPVGLIPVLLFLAALLFLDSYKLVDLRSVLTAIVSGGVAAGASYLVAIGAIGVLAIELARNH